MCDIKSNLLAIGITAMGVYVAVIIVGGLIIKAAADEIERIVRSAE